MMSDHTNFLNIVEGSEAVRERWSALVERTVTEAAQHGVQLDDTDVLNLRSARIAALGAPLDEEEYAAELLNLPALSTAARKKAIAEGDADARAAAINDVNRGKFETPPDRWTDSAARRLSRARDLGVATAPAASESNLSHDQMLEAIAEMPAHLRISQARKWGLL